MGTFRRFDRETPDRTEEEKLYAQNRLRNHVSPQRVYDTALIRYRNDRRLTGAPPQLTSPPKSLAGLSPLVDPSVSGLTTASPNRLTAGGRERAFETEIPGAGKIAPYIRKAVKDAEKEIAGFEGKYGPVGAETLRLMEESRGLAILAEEAGKTGTVREFRMHNGTLVIRGDMKVSGREAQENLRLIPKVSVRGDLDLGGSSIKEIDGSVSGHLITAGTATPSRENVHEYDPGEDWEER